MRYVSLLTIVLEFDLNPTSTVASVGFFFELNWKSTSKVVFELHWRRASKSRISDRLGIALQILADVFAREGESTNNLSGMWSPGIGQEGMTQKDA